MPIIWEYTDGLVEDQGHILLVRVSKRTPKEHNIAQLEDNRPKYPHVNPSLIHSLLHTTAVHVGFETVLWYYSPRSVSLKEPQEQYPKKINKETNDPVFQDIFPLSHNNCKQTPVLNGVLYCGY